MDGDDRCAEGVTEEQAWQALARIFGLVDQRRNLFENRDVFRVLPGSSLAGDNRVSRPYHVSHAAVAALGTAVEHLHAVRSLMVDAQLQYPAAQFTLTRAAIETGAIGVWLLSPPRRSERVLRRLRLGWQDAADSDRAAGEVGVPRPTPLPERRQKFTDVARRATRDPDLTLTKPTTTEIIKAADAEISPAIHVPTVWRICAGFSHGRLWTTLGVLDREEVPGSAEPGVAHYRVKSSLQSLLLAVSTAWAVADLAWDLYGRRRMPPC